ETRIVDAVIEANEMQRLAMIQKIEKLVGNLQGTRIGILGLSFKPETDDMRESPAIDIIRMLKERGAFVKAFDPVAMEES
ncbi:UDP-glucose 6-dehydrogenase, partial [Klebsiella pneumoniae]|nr:UDP-glucose 6-dehydrogenase [Klebsiella pneumoniae]